MEVIGKHDPSGTVLFARLKVEVRTSEEEANSLDASDEWEGVIDKIRDVLKHNCPKRWHITLNDD